MMNVTPQVVSGAGGKVAPNETTAPGGGLQPGGLIARPENVSVPSNATAAGAGQGAGAGNATINGTGGAVEAPSNVTGPGVPGVPAPTRVNISGEAAGAGAG